MSWIDKLLPPQIQHTDPANRKSVPEGLWVKCPSCEIVLYSTDIEANLSVCPKCSHHMSIGARQRLDSLLDPKGRNEIGADIYPTDPLKFKDSKKYPDRIVATQKKTGLTDAVRSGIGYMNNIQIVVACMDFNFIGGSMGSVVGEKISRAIDYAIETRTPLLIISKSGGARMMEAAYSLMQMAKTSVKLALLSKAKIFHCLPTQQRVALPLPMQCWAISILLNQLH